MKNIGLGKKLRYGLVKFYQAMRGSRKKQGKKLPPPNVSFLCVDELPVTDLDKYAFLQKEIRDLRRKVKVYLPYTHCRLLKHDIYKMELIKREMRDITQRAKNDGLTNISLIAAASSNGVIGSGNALPWKLPADMNHFKTLTSGHYVIMGRKTYESIGRPLPNRTNIIITRNEKFKAEGCVVVGTIYDAMDLTKNQAEVFVIGGGEIYKAFLSVASKIYLTEVHEEFEGDAYFPKLNENHWKEMSRNSFEPDLKNKHAHSFVEYAKIPHFIDENNL